MSFEARARELGFAIPELSKTTTHFVPAVRTGDLVYVSGHVPTRYGKPLMHGKLGREVSLEEAQDAARTAVLNCLAAVRSVTGTLDAITRVVKLNGYVASAEGFTAQPQVMNAASSVLTQIFGEAGHHARTAIGVAELPGGAPVEVELIVEVH